MYTFTFLNPGWQCLSKEKQNYSVPFGMLLRKDFVMFCSWRSSEGDDENRGCNVLKFAKKKVSSWVVEGSIIGFMNRVRLQTCSELAHHSLD